MAERLLDDDGENLAVRAFLRHYGAPGMTVKRMRDNMRLAGWDGCWPEWANDQDGHLTKFGTQQWLRHLFCLENASGVAPAQPQQQWEPSEAQIGAALEAANHFDTAESRKDMRRALLAAAGIVPPGQEWKWPNGIPGVSVVHTDRGRELMALVDFYRHQLLSKPLNSKETGETYRQIHAMAHALAHGVSGPPAAEPALPDADVQHESGLLTYYSKEALGEYAQAWRDACGVEVDRYATVGESSDPSPMGTVEGKR